MQALLAVKDLKTYFYTRSGIAKAVDGVSFEIEKGQTLAIVGESGSGKSVTMLSLMGLIPSPPGKVVGGEAFFHGKDLLTLRKEELRRLRGNRIAMIFQDPMTSLNPYLRIATQLTEVLITHGKVTSKRLATAKAIEALERVGISDAASRIDDYPHQFSGGMRQRVMIAMALLTNPDLLIADEPTTALDVTVQAQILELLRELQRDFKMAMILITHDLGVVAGMSDRVLVMYAGRMAEYGSVFDVFDQGTHPYTQGLLRSIPRAHEGSSELYSIPGLPPDPSKLPHGCRFAPRCDKAMAICREEPLPPLRNLGQGHQALCHLEVPA